MRALGCDVVIAKEATDPGDELDETVSFGPTMSKRRDIVKAAVDSGRILITRDRNLWDTRGELHAYLYVGRNPYLSCRSSSCE
jgi:uncharacterized protein with PIN domain